MTTYSEAFYASQRGGSRRSANVIVPMIVDLLAPRSVVDVGCGEGTWLGAFLDNGVDDVMGIDGDYVDRAGLEFPLERFVARDLRGPLGVDRRFDLALCLEVAEHITEDHARGFVRALTGLAPVVLFSAAIPHQGGTGHVNEQWPDYWADLFSGESYGVFDPLRRRIWGDERVDSWYAQNILVFAERGAASDHPGLLAHEAVPAELPLVHPRIYLAQHDPQGTVSSRSALRQTVGAFRTLAVAAMRDGRRAGRRARSAVRVRLRL